MRFDPTTEKNPRLIEAYLRKKVLQYFGNSVEDATKITSANGYYTVNVEHETEKYAFGHFRKQSVPRIVKAMKYLAGASK